MPAPKKYPDEVRERAVRMVFGIREESGQQHGAIARVADRLGVRGPNRMITRVVVSWR
jgi:transposase